MIYYAILFVTMLLLSIGYYHGLCWFFRYNFKWDYASVVGIAFTVSVTAIVYWIPIYGQSTTVDLVSSLFFAFAGALPLMMRFRQKLEHDRAESRAYRKELERWIFDYRSEREQLQAQVEDVLRSQRRIESKLVETLAIIGLRELADQYLKTFEN